MYRRGRKRRWPMMIGLLAILIGCALAFRWFTREGGASPAGAQEPPTQETNGSAGSTQAPTSALNGAALPRDSGSASGPSPAAPRTPAGPGIPPAAPPATSLVTLEQSKPAPGNSVSRDRTNPAGRSSAGNATESPLKISMGEPNTSGSPVTPPQNAAQVGQPAAPPSTSSSTNAGNTAKPPAGAGGPASQRVAIGLELIKQNKPVEARKSLTAALLSPGLSVAESDRIRTELTRLNERLVFSAEVVPGDPFAMGYTIVGGDSLAKLPRKLGLQVDWRFLQRINRISAPERIQVDQRIKAVKGPFHAVVHKQDFRMDLFMGSPGSADRVYVRSFPVGLGEHDNTPEGVFAVRENSKLINPEWVNPRTGERFSADDPANPIGEYWIGLVGASDNIRGLETYGVHGTIDPSSIGAMKSMGCVRLGNEDVALVYELLTEGQSTVEVRGGDAP